MKIALLNYFILIIICNLLILSDIKSQSSNIENKRVFISKSQIPFNIGLIGGINTISSTAYIPLFPNNDECGVYTDGIGAGIFVGINAGIDFLNSNLIADLRIFNEKRPATLKEKSNCFEVLSPIDDKYYPLLRDHKYTAKFSFLAVDVGLKIRLFRLVGELTKVKLLEQIPVYARFGFESGQAMFDKNYNNTETITSPQGVNFPNTNSTKNIVEKGEFDETISSEALNLTMGADFNVYKDLWVSPEISYRYEMTQAIEKYDWNMELLRFGVNVSVAFNQNRIENNYEAEPEDTTSNNQIIVKNDSTKVHNNLGKFVFNDIDFTETIVTQTFPILPYIFFDSTSTDLRDIYRIQNSRFSEDKLSNNTIDIYYNLINIIANRMLKYPNSQFKLVGNTDGAELTSNTERIELAKQRAMSISKIFQSFGIESSRLQIEVRETPKLPTSDKYLEGLQENRRVDIETNNLELLEPVMHSHFLEFALNKKLFFMSQLKDISEMSSIDFSLTSNGNSVFNESVSNISNQIVYHNVKESILNNVSALIDNGVKEVSANIQINYKDGEVESKQFNIQIKKEKSAYEVGRLNLIVFDFDKSNISESNKNMIKSFIANSIFTNSNTTVTGSTDLLGEKNYNKTLSLDRANEVANYIKQINPNYNINEIKGLGSDKILFDNNTPEGRFYCRTVLVEVKTPVKDPE